MDALAIADYNVGSQEMEMLHFRSPAVTFLSNDFVKGMKKALSNLIQCNADGYRNPMKIVLIYFE